MESQPITTPKRSSGRPTKLTPELAEKLVQLIRDGNYYKTACEACGIFRLTRLSWMKRGKAEAERVEACEPPYEDEAIYLEFYYAAIQADAEAECEDIKYIREGKSEWGARAWVRAHRNPERWGSKSRGEQTGEESEPIRAMRVVDR